MLICKQQFVNISYRNWQHFIAALLLLSAQHKGVWCMVLETCLGQFDVHKNTIIRTGESQALGGKYLEGVELDTMEECQRLCCETEACDVYIFEAKNDGFCYLFECGPPENFHCKFTRHANYTSAVLTKSRAANDATKPIVLNVTQQEIELSNLKVKPVPIVLHDDKPVEALNNMAAAKAQQQIPTQKPLNHLPQCGRFQFGCHTGECIAIYNACDGIPQCADGSDEGPECLGAPANQQPVTATKPLAASTTVIKDSSVQQIHSINAGDNVVQQQLVSNLPHGLPLPVDNREDHAAWANRQLVAELQQQAASKTKSVELEPHVSYVANVAPIMQPAAQMVTALPAALPAKPMYTAAQTGQVYRTENNQQAVNVVNYASQYEVTAKQNWQTPINNKEQQNIQAIVASKTEQNPLNIGNVASVQEQQIVRVVPHSNIVVAASHNVVAQQSNKPVEPSNNDAYEEDYEEKTTEAPKRKQHRHKKVKSKSEVLEKPQIETAEEVNSKSAISFQQPALGMHEQYKALHDSLALEFRDHDGYAERPGGAMLSLTLGLLVTAALALLIGCRMRTVRKRARRPGGKLSYAHESDFLVNGMYL